VFFFFAGDLQDLLNLKKVIIIFFVANT